MRRLKIGNRVIEHWQIIAVFLAVYDFVAICASYFMALLIRFHGYTICGIKEAGKTTTYGINSNQIVQQINV